MSLLPWNLHLNRNDKMSSAIKLFEQYSIFLILTWGYVFLKKMIWERERETTMWERNIYWLLPVHTLTHNLGMRPDQELNPQPFSVQDGTPTKALDQEWAIFLKPKSV